MAINWNPLNIEKPQFVSAKEVMDNMRGMRDQRAKFATEQATRASLTSAGDIDPTAMRQSLINQGFGELADQAVSQAMATRRKDVGDVAELGTKIQAMVQAGMIEPERARELFNNVSSVKAIPARTEVPDMSWAEGVPVSTANPQDSSVDGTVRITATSESLPAENEYIRTEKKAQIAPEYASDLFKFEKTSLPFAGSVTSGGATGIKYELPTSKQDADNIIRGARALGFSSSASSDLDNWLSQKAASEVPVPQFVLKDPNKPMESFAEYQLKVAEYPALVAKTKAGYIKQLEDFNRSYAAEGRAVAGEKRAEEQLGIAKTAEARAQEKNRREASQTSLPEVLKTELPSPAEKATAIERSAASKGITSNLETLALISPNDPKFSGARTGLAKDIIIAYGLGVSEGVLGELEGLVANGASFSDFNKILMENGGGSEKAIKGLAKTLEILSGTKNLETIAALAKSAQEFARNAYIPYGVKDISKFDEMFPIYGTPSRQSATRVLNNKGISSKKPATINAGTDKKKPLAGVKF